MLAKWLIVRFTSNNKHLDARGHLRLHLHQDTLVEASLLCHPQLEAPTSILVDAHNL